MSKVVEVYRATGEVYGLAGELVNLADYALEADDIDDAMACLREAEPLADQLDSPGLTSYLHGNSGLVALRIGATTRRGQLREGHRGFARASTIVRACSTT